MLAVATDSPRSETPHAGAAEPSTRRGRAAAILLDLAIGVALALGAGVVAFAWLLARTDAGARDVSSGDAALAFALLLAAVPAWLGRLAAGLLLDRGTPGQRRAGLRVEGSPVARVVRLALHPIGALGWVWLAVVAAIAAAPILPLLLASMAVIVVTMALITQILVIRRPDAAGVHDLITGTRLARR